MKTFFKDIFWVYRNEIYNKVQLVPLKEIYFSDIESGMLKQGDWKLVMILLSVGIAILLFAVINYINLTVAESGFRAKEMATQTYHLIHAPLGYNTANIIDISTTESGFNSKEDISVFVNEVKQLASVKRVGLAKGTPFNGGNNFSVVHGKNISFQLIGGDTVCFEMLGLQKLKENNLGNQQSSHYFRQDAAYYFSQQAAKETGLDENVTTIKLADQWTIQVAGIIKDIRLSNITLELKPILFFYNSFKSDWPWDILIETQGDPTVAFQQVRQVFERVLQVDFNGQYIDDQIKESFAAQQRMSRIVILFTVIAVLISLLGLLAMSIYFIRWIFIAAGAFCLLVSFVSVYWQSRRAAHANPVNALKMK